MLNTSAKNKIIILSLFWVVLCAVVFGYLFGILDQANQKTVNSMAQQKKDLALLKAESESYKRARQDLQTLSEKSYQPENFFNRDITFVNEIRSLEDWASRLGVDVQISGISGTVAGAPKAKTTTPIAVFPVGISISGSLEQVVKYIQVLENLSFVSNINAVNLGNGSAGKIGANLSANFYISK